MFQYFTENDQRSDAQEKTEKQVCNLTLKRTDAAPGVVVLSLLTWDLMKYVYYCSSQAHSLETFIERQPQVGSFFLSFFGADRITILRFSRTLYWGCDETQSAEQRGN